MGLIQLNKVAALQQLQRKQASVKTQLPAQKPDSFERTKFNINDAINNLSAMKGLSGKPRFNEEKLNFIKAELEQAPEKWEPFKTIIKNPKIIGSIACELLAKDSDDLKNIADLSELKKEDNSPKFSALELRNLAKNLAGEEIKKFKILSECNLGIDNLIELAKNENLTKPEKAVIKVFEMDKLCRPKNGFYNLELKPDIYDKKAFMITAMTDSVTKKQLLDKNLNSLAIEENKTVTRPDGRKYTIKKNADYRNNTTSKVVLENNPKLPQPVLVSEIRVIKDKNGNKVRTEYTSQSEVPGVLNIKHVFPDGREQIISSATFDEKTGVTSVKKNMVSLDGTKTEYLFEDDKQGNRIADYKITNKKGNVLLNNSLSFEVVNDNKFISSHNKNKYEIEVKDKSINIKDVNNNKTHTINFENYIGGNKNKILDVMKKMPGEELIALSKNTKELEGIDDIVYSTYGAVNKKIKTGDNLFVMLHELGHAKDYGQVDVKEKETLTKSIYNNKKVNEIFEKEKALFNKAFPDAQRNHINYFIKESEYKDGIQEAIAESNALLSTYNNDDLFAIRAQYLQQYFPKTIATLANELSK